MMAQKIILSALFTWSDDLRIALYAHGGRVWFTTLEYKWLKRNGRKTYSYTSRHPIPGQDLPLEAEDALREVEKIVKEAGYELASRWEVQTTGMGNVPLGKWLETCGDWGHYCGATAKIVKTG